MITLATIPKTLKIYGMYQFLIFGVFFNISFKSMFKFIPEKHQETYGEFVAEEKSCKCKVEKYNAKVTEYNV